MPIEIPPTLLLVLRRVQADRLDGVKARECLQKAYCEAVEWHKAQGHPITSELLRRQIPEELLAFSESEPADWIFQRQYESGDSFVKVPLTVEDVLGDVGGLPLRAETEQSESKSSNEALPSSRRAFFEPALTERGWSLYDWAAAANVDTHTVRDYVDNRTNPRRSSLQKMAAAIGIDVSQFPD